jgi:tRNA1(Val) A37 N6-methylase TrmN6
MSEAPTASNSDVTDDVFLGDRLSILQPRSGFRAGLDSIILAASLAPRAGERLYEPGAGVGVASLCAASRLQDVTISGLEVDPVAHALSLRNTEKNGFDSRVTFHGGSILNPPEPVREQIFDQVFLNPPYLRPEDGNAPPDPARARAHTGDVDGPSLEEWLGHAVRRLRPRGRLTLVQRADRLDQILACLAGDVGMLTVFPLWPMNGRPAKRVIVTGRRSITGGLTMAPGLVLHHEDGRPTAQLEAIARSGAGLDVINAK